MLNLQKEYTSINIKNAEYEISEIQKRYDKANTEEGRVLELNNINLLNAHAERLRNTKVFFKNAEGIIKKSSEKISTRRI